MLRLRRRLMHGLRLLQSRIICLRCKLRLRGGRALGLAHGLRVAVTERLLNRRLRHSLLRRGLAERRLREDLGTSAVNAATQTALTGFGRMTSRIVVKTRCDHRHTQLIAHVVIEGRADNLVGVAAHEVLHDAHHFADFGIGHRFSRSRHINEKAAGTLKVCSFQKRAGNRLFRCFTGAVRTACGCRTHHSRAAFTHHGTQVFEVNIDDAGRMNDLGNTVTGLVKHIVCGGKAVNHRGLTAHFVFELVVENHDEAVDLVLKVFNAGLRLAHTAGTFKLKGLGDDRNRENAELFGNLGNHGSRTGSGAAAHAGRDKEKMRTLKRLTDLVGGFLCGHGTHFGFGARTEPGLTERNHDVGPGAAQRLLIRVGSNKRNSLSLIVDHVLNGIAAATADTDDFDAGIEMIGLFRNGLKRHGYPFYRRADISSRPNI